MIANPDFLAVMEANFSKDQKLIVSCRSGGRSARAVSQLEAAGFTQLLDMKAGFVGGKDPFGQPLPGWQSEGREVEVDAEENQLYVTLAAKAK